MQQNLKRKTPYYYSTFENEMVTADGKHIADNESVVSDKKKIIVLVLDQIESDKELSLIIVVCMEF